MGEKATRVVGQAITQLLRPCEMELTSCPSRPGHTASSTTTRGQRQGPPGREIRKVERACLPFLLRRRRNGAGRSSQGPAEAVRVSAKGIRCPSLIGRSPTRAAMLVAASLHPKRIDIPSSSANCSALANSTEEPTAARGGGCPALIILWTTAAFSPSISEVKCAPRSRTDFPIPYKSG